MRVTPGRLLRAGVSLTKVVPSCKSLLLKRSLHLFFASSFILMLFFLPFAKHSQPSKEAVSYCLLCALQVCEAVCTSGVCTSGCGAFSHSVLGRKNVPGDLLPPPARRNCWLDLRELPLVRGGDIGRVIAGADL